jgi:hypothetical protein
LTASKPQTATLIDTLSEGYAAVNRRPWLLVVPMLLNLYLVFGAQLSFAPLFTSLSGLMQRMQPAGSDAALTQDVTDAVAQLGQVDMRRQLAVLNFVPTLPLVRQEAAEEPDTIRIGGLGGAVLAFVLINSVALPLSALFMVLTGRAVRSEPPFAGELPRSIGRVALAMLAYIAVIAAVGLAIGLPYMFLSGMLMLLSPPLGLLAVLVLQLIGFWAWIYIGFANEAIVMGGHGPLRAIRSSFTLVRHNFWGTLGFLGLSAFVIPLGLGVVWQALSGSTAGLVAAAVGSAYIGCGLAAARMVFYRERIRRAQNRPVYAGTGR